MKLKIRKNNALAQLPKYQTDGAACFDLHSIDNGFVPSGKSAVFGTGLEFEIPDGFVMLVYSRSGQGFKDDIRLANCVGVIDSDYRGEVRIKLTSDHPTKTHSVSVGDRIAQCMILPVPEVEIEEVSVLSETARGTGAYGSTGK